MDERMLGRGGRRMKGGYGRYAEGRQAEPSNVTVLEYPTLVIVVEEARDRRSRGSERKSGAAQTPELTRTRV